MSQVQDGHYEMILKQEIWKDACEINWHLEEPRVGQCYPNYYVAQLASRFVKVVLSSRVVMNCLGVSLAILSGSCGKKF